MSLTDANVLGALVVPSLPSSVCSFCAFCLKDATTAAPLGMLQSQGLLARSLGLPSVVLLLVLAYAAGAGTGWWYLRLRECLGLPSVVLLLVLAYAAEAGTGRGHLRCTERWPPAQRRLNP